ncbi:DNA-binding transcriptional LysR family regulator [Bradyrhizobium diazoefficiens]
MARINSRQVEAFRATMLTGSVTEAAALMTVTQPAVSRLLRDLQALLKMELFERRGTGLVPTAAAMALYTEVERSFVGLERITAAAEEIRGRRTGSLRIAALPALSNGYLPRLAGHFLKERPNLNLAFFGVISPIVVDWVLNNQCDIGFAEVPIAHSGLPSLRLPALARVAVLPTGHRLAEKEVLEPRDFEGETFISLSAGSSSRHLVDQVFHRHDVRRVLRVETTLSEIMCGMVSSGLGVAICDPFTAQGILHPRRRGAPLPAAHRLRILRGLSGAAQPLAGGAGSGRDHAQVARGVRGLECPWIESIWLQARCNLSRLRGRSARSAGWGLSPHRGVPGWREPSPLPSPASGRGSAPSS